jgi:HK97 family phage major capsid protein
MPLPHKVEARQSRAVRVERASINEEARTVDIAFSSEEPVERWWGVEILGHAAGEIDEDWIGGGTAPVLCDHNARDVVGVVETVSLGSDRKARAVVRFGKSARAEEIFADVRDGIRSNISVGYELLALDLVKEEKGKPPIYRATRWRPLEVSFVSIPADMSVGVGRDATDPPPSALPLPASPIPSEESRSMSETLTAPPTADQIGAAAKRYTDEIMALATLANARDKGLEAIAAGKSVEVFRGELLLARGSEAKPLVAPPSEIGLSNKEVRAFSLARYILAQANNDPALAPLEWEASQAAGRALQAAGTPTKQGRAIPYEILNAPIPTLSRGDDGRWIIGAGGRNQRDLGTGTVGAGGAMVATNLLADDFITLLRNVMMVRAMGATILGGLVGNIAIPRQTGAGTGNWLAQGGANTEGDQVFAQLSMAPKTVHAMTDFTRELLLQGSPDIEGLVRTDLAIVVGLAIDAAALHGPGTNAPTGIAATAGIGSVAGGTNGLIPTWDNIVDLETQVANGNAAVDQLGYLTNTRVRGRLKRTPIISGQPVFIWGGMPGMAAQNAGTVPVPFSVMNEYRAGVSNQVSNTLTKGSASGICSAIFFGNWRDLIIGEWGSLETLTDNITQAANRIIRVHAYQSADIGVRRAASFAAMLDALT